MSEALRTRPACATCRFWQDGAAEAGRAYGWCRRYAPRLPSKYGSDAAWPATHAEDWCGDWEARPG